MTSPHGAPAPGDRLRTLRGLAAYACGHTGSCCRAGWPIPVEPVPLELLRQGEAAGLLPDLAPGSWTHGGILGRTTESTCVFHAPAVPGGGCRVESSLGTAALAYSCRQFPRVLLVDARGWHLSLSAWCGTATEMIVSPSSPSPVGGDTCFMSFDYIHADARVHLESLDARDAWPPLLKPGVLAGHAVYSQWETLTIERLLTPVEQANAALVSALASLLCWTDTLRAWKSADGALEVLARRSFAPPDPRRLLRTPADRAGLEQVRASLLSRVPPEWRPHAWPAGLTDATDGGAAVSRAEADAILARYLATRLIGSWVTYQGQGLRSVSASLVSAYVLIALALSTPSGAGTGSPVTIGRMTSAIRASDWLLLHLLDRTEWADWCAGYEMAGDARPLLALVGGAARELDALTWSA